jgi:hypothetical protein
MARIFSFTPKEMRGGHRSILNRVITGSKPISSAAECGDYKHAGHLGGKSPVRGSWWLTETKKWTHFGMYFRCENK